MKQYVMKLKSGMQYIATVDDTCDLVSLMRTIHANGHFLDHTIYIALAEIAYVIPLGPPVLKTNDELAAMQAQGSA